MPTKKYALCPGVRGEECEHGHVAYSGDIPCTGYRYCTMCGMRFYSDEEIKKARQAAVKWRPDRAAFRARMKQLLGFYREEVRGWVNVGRPGYMRAMLAAYRQSIRTMFGMED